MRPRRTASLLVLAGTGLAGALAACVDLFHATDFTTLCTTDAAACLADSGELPDGETGAPAPAIDFCAWSAREARERAERACAWLGACGGPLPRTSFGACMRKALTAYDCTLNPSLRPRGRTAEAWSCLAAVNACADLERCVFGGSPPLCPAVASGTSFSSCAPSSPTTVIECGRPAAGGPSGVEPCLLEGRACTVSSSSRATCAGNGGLGCAGEPRCDGTHAVVCNGAADDGLDCAAFGDGRCVPTGDAGRPACVPAGAAATSCAAGDGEFHCDPTGVPRACVDGREIAIQCAQLDQTCVVPPDAGLTPLDPLSACGPIDAAAGCDEDDSCSGDTLRSCDHQVAFEISCAKLGLKPCTQAAREPFVACQPP